MARVDDQTRKGRLVLYAGQPQGDPIVSYGPFIGDSREDIVRLYTEYRAGRFERLSTLARVTSIA
jgi:redox-sensitive bicupin YhaK (pirin superfamily)